MTKPVLKITNATLAFGERTLWSDLNLSVDPGEFIAVIGSNGSGKSSLLKAILGQQELDQGTIEIAGHQKGHGCTEIGYIPQHRGNDGSVPVRAKELIRFGLDGHKFGFSWPSQSKRKKITEVLRAVNAESYANKPIGQLSGGELQRVRVGQAVISNPQLILADEPLSALDLQQQKAIAELLDAKRREQNAAVLFVTHDVNPILSMVDRVLYLANGKFKIGAPDEVLRSSVLSELYGTPVDVVRNQGRIAVMGVQDHHHHHGDDEVWN